MTPNSVLVIADQGNYRLRSVSSGLPPDKADGVFEVPDAETQESYIFNKFGQHEITKDLMTGMTKYKMTYTQTTSTGKLASVTNAYGAKLTVLRDFKGQVNALQTASGLKFDLEMSRVGDLETLTSQQMPLKTSFRYHGSSGLLKSKLDSHYSYHYEYDIYGRLVQAILPTGEAIGLHFNLTSQGASIEMTSNGLLRDIVLVQDQLVSTRPAASDLKRRVVSVTSDKTLILRDPRGYGTTVGTIPHPVIGLTDSSVMADSFPMPGEQRTFLGTNLINTLTWKYSLASGANSGSMMGISKTLKVNNEDLLNIFYDKLQRRQVLYSMTSPNGKDQLLEIRYDSLSRPLKTEPAKGSGFATLEQTYDLFGNLNSWTWGDLQEKLSFDQTGRLISKSRSNQTLMTYDYEQPFDVLPKAVILNESRYELVFDKVNGGLQRIKTPMGHSYDFNLKSSVGLMRFQVRFPWLEDQTMAFELMYNGLGHKMRKRMPSKGQQQITYTYDNSNMLRKTMVGETESEFGYDEDTGLVESVVTRCGHHFDMRTRMKHHGGLMKEMKIRFSGSSSPDFDNAVFR